MTVLEGEVLPPVRARAGDASTRFVFQPSPFQRGSVRAIVLPEGGTIADAVALTGIGPRLRKHVAVYLADHRIDPRHWKRIRPKPGASLFVRIEMHGGDGDQLLRTVLMIAVVIIASIYAGPIAGALGIGGAIGTAVVQAGLIFAGQLLINALIPPPKIGADPFRFDQQAGNPYASLTGFRNAYAPYAPIPRVMGTRRMYPMIAARPYTEMEGKTQWLRLLLLVGYGPCEVSDIRIGTTPIASFAGSEYEVREGWPDDAPPSLYTRLIRETSLSAFLEYNVWVERSTEYDTEEVSVDVTFPNGLIGIDPDDGDEDPRTITIDVQWSANGGSSWSSADWINPSSDYGTQTDGILTCTAQSKSVEVRSGRFKVTGNADGQYKVRLRRISQDDVPYLIDDAYWTVLRSVKQDNPINMTGLTLISLRLQATKQLNGVPDIINCIASAYHDVYDTETETWSKQLTSNPAWQVADVLRRRGTTALASASRVNLDPASPYSLVSWALANDVPAPNANEPRWSANIVLEGGAIQSAVQLLAASGRAQFTMIDGKYSVVRDIEQETPVAHITPRNSWGYRGAKSFAELPHALRVSFVNPNRNDALDEVIVYRDAYNEDGSGGKTAASRFETLDLPACRSEFLAWREGRYHLAVLELRPEEHVVNQEIESLAATAGALVQFSHDVISIGLGEGRIQMIDTVAGFVTGVTIDCLMEMVEGRDYGLRIRHADQSSSVHPLVWREGAEYHVQFVTPVAVAEGPELDDLAMFGERDIETAPMLVKRIDRGEGFAAKITLIDAQPGVHTADTGPIPPFRTYINSTTPIDTSARPDRPILNVRSDETALLRLSDGTLMERVELWLDPYTSTNVVAPSWEAEWRVDGGNGDDWSPVGTGPIDASLFLMGRTAGQIINLRARSISIHGVPSEWDYIWEHEVIGKTTPPDPPTVFVSAATVQGGQLTWTPPTTVDLAGHELRYGGASWEAATVLGRIYGANAKQIFHTIALTGGETFRIKAFDTSGLYSTEVTAVSTGRTTATGGVITDWRGLPTNALLGTAIVRSLAAVLSSASSSSIAVAAHDVYAPSQTIALPSDTITGLATDTLYWVFWDFTGNDYVTTTSLSTYAADTTGRYMIVGYQRTQNGGGGFSPPPPPPPGGGTLPYTPMPD